MNLLSATITAAAAAVVGPVFTPGVAPVRLTVQCNFTYGSGGTTVDAWLQTTLDNGATWSDIANFHVTTAAFRKAINLSAMTPVTTQVALTDGSMAANTAQDGLLGPRYRVKYTSTGTYAGGTVLAIDLAACELPAGP